ncbi:hypothetical protein QYF61_004500 [Mycteria americana]|uniref:RNase H type-1 domain-containing protein n=1 Tax=Mycteria americana TaxID=33587 RepID=A0AAN7MPP9_MYCAM|nr:hypothetical protein QYF61_004500 [Mycteria americana]
MGIESLDRKLRWCDSKTTRIRNGMKRSHLQNPPSLKRPDLKEEPLEDAQDSWFTDGSSFVRQGIRKAGYAVTTASKVIESQSLPAGTSAQKAEIIALTRALELAKGKKINIWTDSKYAFGVVHTQGAIWKE